MANEHFPSPLMQSIEAESDNPNISTASVTTGYIDPASFELWPNLSDGANGYQAAFPGNISWPVLDPTFPELTPTSHPTCMLPYPGPTPRHIDPTDGQQFATASKSYNELSDNDHADMCYAQLLYRCLREAPGHTMSLRDLYAWVKDRSQKAKDPENKGWQNSVRHNLSMNAAFERVPPSENNGVKKGCLWRLTPQALREGVIPTTRYRKDPKRKPEHRSSPVRGQATRNAVRRQKATREARSFSSHSARQRQLRHQLPPNSPFMMSLAQPYPPSPQPYMAQTTEAPGSPNFVSIDDTLSMATPAFSTPPHMQMMYDANYHDQYSLA